MTCVGSVRLDREGSPRAVGSWFSGVYVMQIPVAARPAVSTSCTSASCSSREGKKNRPPVSTREPPQEPLALDRDAGDAADADDVHRRPGRLDRGERLVERGRAVFVVAVRDQDRPLAALGGRQDLRQLRERIENRRAPCRTDRLYRFDDGRPDRWSAR